MSKNEYIKKIKDLLESARQDHDESAEDMNSYGHGYDTGRIIAIKEILDLLEDKNA